MAMQGYGSAPSRNPIKAAGAAKPGKVPVGAPHASAVTSDGHTQNAPAAGSGVKGFSGGGTLKAYVK